MPYLIKVTYTEGKHAGKSYLLRRGGYVTDENAIQWEDTVYATERIAKAVCTKLYKNNEFNRRIERNDEKIRIAKGRGKKEFYIYESCTYEPYPVDVVL